MSTALPYPPPHLASRVGPGEGENPTERYEREGAAVRERILRMLPADWDWTGKRVLDFGCGAARVLRQFADRADTAELWGCDIDAPSIEWIQRELSPPLHAFTNGLAPPLDVPDDRFDLVWATSVFTHIDDWSAWLLELHRVLRPGGLLIATFLGEGMFEALIGMPYDEDRVGMTVRRHWVDGGPGAEVFHSRWWLHEHWGRAFEVLEIADPPRDPGGGAAVTHSYIALRAREGTFTAAELEAVRREEPREVAALQTSVRVLRAELEWFAASQAAPAGFGESARSALRATPLIGPARAVRRRLSRPGA